MSRNQEHAARLTAVNAAREAAAGGGLQHPPTVALVAELEQVRTQARLLVRSYGPCAYRAQTLLRLEARQRYLRQLLRSAMGEAESVDVGQCSPVVHLRANYGLG